MLTASMFEGGTFEGNRARLEGELGRECSKVPLARFTLIDPGRKVDRLEVEVREGKYVTAALLATMAGGRPSFTFTADEMLVVKAFFAAYWLSPDYYEVIQFLQRVGAMRVELAWRGQSAFEREGAIVDGESTPFVEGALDMMELGLLRAATEDASGWTAHPWIKRAILVALKSHDIEPSEAGILRFADKLIVQTPRPGVRVVPPGTIRRGACVMPGAIVMPGYVNVGAYVDRGSMVDTFATVGSCAQIGRDVHLAGGVGIGGVLEPPNGMPVIIEDGAFVGSRAVVVEGVRVEREAVIAAGVTITATTPVIDMTGEAKKEYRGHVPARAIVVPGTRKKKFPAGVAQIACAYIIGYRDEATSRKVSLEAALRRVREIGACV